MRLRVLTAGGPPLSLAGKTLKLTVKRKSTDGEALASVAGTLTGYENAEFTIPAVATKDLPFGRYVYDVWIDDIDVLVPFSPLVLGPRARNIGGP